MLSKPGALAALSTDHIVPTDSAQLVKTKMQLADPDALLKGHVKAQLIRHLLCMNPQDVGEDIIHLRYKKSKGDKYLLLRDLTSVT